MLLPSTLSVRFIQPSARFASREAPTGAPWSAAGTLGVGGCPRHLGHSVPRGARRPCTKRLYLSDQAHSAGLACAPPSPLTHAEAAQGAPRPAGRGAALPAAAAGPNLRAGGGSGQGSRAAAPPGRRRILR